jgi:hypothetical protein
MTHNLYPFKPITYNLSSEKKRFQSLPFECNLQRYTKVHCTHPGCGKEFSWRGAVHVACSLTPSLETMKATRFQTFNPSTYEVMRSLVSKKYTFQLNS